MKRNIFFFLLVLILSRCKIISDFRIEKISLSGEWNFIIDSLDRGVVEGWYNNILPEKVRLPGSIAENGKGYEVSVNTPWTGDIVDRSYFTEEKYAKYRQTGNIKIPFWLKPVKYYKGVAWYQKEVEIPEEWKDKKVKLFLERPHWESVVFVNGSGAGSCNALATPHEYDISTLVKSGKNIITIRIDNRVIIPVGVNSHSISDHTQGNWNGIAGEISLRASSPVDISQIRIYPDLARKKARVIVSVEGAAGSRFSGKLILSAGCFNSPVNHKVKAKSVPVTINTDKAEFIIEYPMGRKPLLWDEFNPSMYRLEVILKNDKGEILDKKEEDFGMREIKAEGTRLSVNGTQVFLRGTTECCIFPLTGYPPSDTTYWMKIMRTLKEYGLNHMRFHSYCPPEAAFIAADITGIYLHVECSSWANQGTAIGYGEAIDTFIYREGDRIIREYGNHPSFIMLAYGNEPAGRNQKDFLGKLITYWKSIDNRRVYTSAAGWPVIPENDYNLISDPRIQHWGEGVKSIINAQPPRTDFDFRDVISKYGKPVIGHEIGQWCAYPDFSEIEKYTGILKPTNFEIFRETLEENGMGGQAWDFLMASGKLQVLCYKADIEAALRTPGFAGFQMLQLHDFPGQGTALVGILNSFFESKGYVTPEEFRMFCNETVPLARMEKLVYQNNETFKADVEMAHFGREPLRNVTLVFGVNNGKDVLKRDSIKIGEIPLDNCFRVGSFSMGLAEFARPRKLTFEVQVKGTEFRNRWDFWVYPAETVADTGDVYITDRLDEKARNILGKGGRVLLLTYGKVAKGKGAEVAVGFSSIFWNTAWTNGQAPHTLGILCNPEHPLFRDFPSEYHSNWQWWDPVTHSQAMILDDFPSNLKPLVQMIDDWFKNRRLGLLFEAKCGNGKIIVCSINLTDTINKRPPSRQLLCLMLNYMNSEKFNPDVEVDARKIEGLLATKAGN
ncbi:MAG: sugar-binding domain-containing protein [Bacteroidales bacterium]